MNKELIIKFATGLIAKLIRYLIAAIGGTTATASVSDTGVNIMEMAAGIATIGVSVAWSMWEDRVKKAKAEAAHPVEEKPLTPQP
jgi:tartrate dehydratase alpha subunit/fumarate hydratase class I-like protein